MAIKTKNTYTDISLDFNNHPLSNDIVKVVDENSIKQSVELLLSMEYYESPMQPWKGSGVGRLLFEPMGVDVVIELREAIKEVLDKYEPRITVEEIRVVADYDDARYDIKLIFKILNNINLSVISFILRKVN